MYYESECSETEDAEASIIIALTNMLDIIYEESNQNWLLRALSRGYFWSPDYYSEVREILLSLFFIILGGFKLFTWEIRWIYPKKWRMA